MDQHDAVEVIIAKRDGGRLSDTQIDWVIDAYTRGEVADEQMSALAMAILLNGMGRREIARWTDAMIRSGERMDFSGLSRPTADKHSTGGVGDKITLPLAPLVAVYGVAVPQLSGRGLGHTGGTLDKLESIPGWRAHLSNAEMLAQLSDLGAVICAAGSGLAPADKKLYALRDVTGTVPSLPLIAGSIMSKKLAAGADAIVLDVKCGRGAFMETLADAQALARQMVAIGTLAGRKVTALITQMEQPLGLAVGNALEVQEAIATLHGRGPADFQELVEAVAGEMLLIAGAADDLAGARDLVSDVIADGRAFARFRDFVASQGGDPALVDHPDRLPAAPVVVPVPAPASGFVHALDAREVGLVTVELGGGRQKKGDPIDPAVGVMLAAKVGSEVAAGEPLCTVHAANQAAAEAAIPRLQAAYIILPEPADPLPIVLDRVTG
ncbi:MAG: thymidine phosphorylase [Caldilinea sp.]|nr:thymidine phosphorylase [Caldilinea sp.]